MTTTLTVWLVVCAAFYLMIEIMALPSAIIVACCLAISYYTAKGE